MSNPIVIKSALANLGDDVVTEEIYNYIESNSEDFELYQIDSKKVSATAIDFIIILGAIGAITSIASLLWTAYEKFIKPKKSKMENSGGIYIYIDSGLKFWIGNWDKDKETFIKDFTTKVTEFSKKDIAGNICKETKHEIRFSKVWIKRK